MSTQTQGQGQTRPTLQRAIVAELDLAAFPRRGYRDRDYLAAALEAGFTVADLATAHDVSKKSIYRALDAHGLACQQPPSHGPARRLWNLDPDAIGDQP